MKTIYKYQLAYTRTFSIEMPQSAKILTVLMQGGIPCIWAEIDTTKPMVNRKFILLTTGEEMRGLGSAAYVGSFVATGTDTPWFVGHLYDLGEYSDNSY
jgi:hypothetical protein